MQRQIEKMFVDANDRDDKLQPVNNIKHTMHGVSHVRPDEEDKYCTPPPVHYGVEKALQARKDSKQFSNFGEDEQQDIRLQSSSSLFNPSDSDKSKTENFNSRSTIHERSIDRKDKFLSLDSLDSRSSRASTFVDLGNIDVKAERRKSVDTESLAAQVRRRERAREEDANIRRISVHQDTFDYGTIDSNMSTGSLQSRIEVPANYTTSVNIQKSKPVRYKIEYLGAVPLRGKASNLDALQVPLKELYLKHKALQSLGHSNLPGTLEISDTGLRVQYIRELHKGVQELFNSFPTIAVWAAVRFSHKTVILPSSERRQKFAFVPLISDPQNEEKKRIFYDLDYEEINLAQTGPHPPVFACVMRRSGMPKQLECHGFICSSSEDAIIIAANLYQALVDTMKRNKTGGGQPRRADPTSPHNLRRDDLSRRSSRKSMRRGEPPVRPPRKKRVKGDEPRVVTGLVRRRSIRSSTRSARSNRSNRSSKSARRRMETRGSRPGKIIPLQRDEMGRQSSRRGQEAGKAVSGDLLTKVSIGRTKSFVKTGNQYNLQELFRELKEKEGVESIDDVLKRVISPNGMSFNDIKPVYRELLLKLAMTMSQDEIFERSKSIMASSKKLKKKQRDNENSGSLGSFFKSFSRPSSKTNSLATKKPDVLAIHSDRPVKPVKSSKSSKGKHFTKADISGPLPILDVHKPSVLSKEKEALAKDDQTDDAYVSCSECTYESVCNYDSCTCRMKKSIRPAAEDIKNLISKGKDVMSECDADSCISTDKCYCSLRGDPRHKSNQSNASVYSEITADSGTVTDTSCYSTNCYGSHGSISSRPHIPLSSCASPMTAWKQNTMTEKEMMQSSSCCSCSEYESGGALSSSLKFTRNLPPIPSDAVSNVQRRKSSVSGGSTFATSNISFNQQWQSSTTLRRNVLDGRGSEGSSSCSSSSNRSSVSPTNSSSRSFLSSPTNPSSPKVLVVSAVDPRGNLVYRGSQQQQRLTTAQSRDEENILSLKKSAEIAALFSGAKISQTTDLVDRFGSESESCSCSRGSLGRSTLSGNHPGAHLGYFP